MLFNSWIFVFVFLPIAWGVFVALTPMGRTVAIAWVCVASLVFYGYSSPYFLAILLCSLAANFLLANILLRSRGLRMRRTLLFLGVAGNLSVIGYFKYVNFFITNLAPLVTVDPIADLALPLGISFYTFQKIVFLVDIYRGQVKEIDPLGYFFFISFFAQLIAGPIVHYGEVVPQLRSTERRDRYDDLVKGGSLFVIGLFKKVVIADSIALPSSRFFNGVANGATPEFSDAWLAALCYALQIYYDFSAYSDMAVGLGRMFGVDLPINFASPYKAASIIEFWRRWHITLSRLLRDYVYIPLGGGRCGRTRRAINIMLTMLIGGVWHGAAWAFVAWGGLHGLYLLINHWWSTSRMAETLRDKAGWRITAHVLTLVCVVFAWVPFRAADFGVALGIWEAMVGFHGIGVPPHVLALAGAVDTDLVLVGPRAAVAALVLLAATLVLPNSYQLMARAGLGTPTKGYPATYISPDRRAALIAWRPTLTWGLILGAMFGLTLVKINDASEFIYFQF